MKTSPVSNKRSVTHNDFWQQVLLWPLAKIALLWAATLRIEIDPESERLLRDQEQPVLLLLWHNRLFFVSRLARQFRPTRQIKGLISASQDGAWLATFFKHAGIGSVRGSSSWRGMQSMRELVQAHRQGFDLGITPDGPRGPAYQSKPGVIALQRITKARAVLIGVECKQCWRLNSWDRFILPKPFAKIIVRVQALDHLDSLDRTKSSVDAATEKLTRALNSINP